MARKSDKSHPLIVEIYPRAAGRADAENRATPLEKDLLYNVKRRKILDLGGISHNRASSINLKTTTAGGQDIWRGLGWGRLRELD